MRKRDVGEGRRDLLRVSFVKLVIFLVIML